MLPDTGKYVIVKNVPILDEHKLYDQDGRLQAVIDEAKLKKIVQNNSRRILETGDEVPIVIGHTDDDKDEKNQPEIVGYATDFKVQRLFRTARKAITATFKLLRNKVDKVKEFPRRSVELWMRKWEIDPISLLGASTPERSLGLLRFSRHEGPHYRRVYMNDQSSVNPQAEDMAHQVLALIEQTDTWQAMERIAQGVEQMAMQQQQQQIPQQQQQLQQQQGQQPMPAQYGSQRYRHDPAEHEEAQIGRRGNVRYDDEETYESQEDFMAGDGSYCVDDHEAAQGARQNNPRYDEADFEAEDYEAGDTYEPGLKERELPHGQGREHYSGDTYRPGLQERSTGRKLHGFQQPKDYEAEDYDEEDFEAEDMEAEDYEGEEFEAEDYAAYPGATSVAVPSGSHVSSGRQTSPNQHGAFMGKSGRDAEYNRTRAASGSRGIFNPQYRGVGERSPARGSMGGSEGRLARGTAPVRKSRHGELVRLQRRTEGLENTVYNLRLKLQASEREKDLLFLSDPNGEGIIMDIDQELQELAPLPEDQYRHRIGIIRKNYQRLPTSGIEALDFPAKPIRMSRQSASGGSREQMMERVNRATRTNGDPKHAYEDIMAEEETARS